MRPTLARLLLPLLALALLSTGGCLSTAKLRGLAVQLVDVRAAEAAAGQPQLVLSIRYINENLVPIAASGSEHRLTLDGVLVGRAESDRPIGLPQQGAEIQEITMTVNPAAVPRLRAMQASGAASYQLESVIIVDTGEDELESKTIGTGSVSLANLSL